MGTNPAMCAEAFEIYVPDPSAKEEFSLPEPHIRKRPPGVLQRKSDIGVSSVSKTDHDDPLGHVLNHRVASRLSNPLGEFGRGECHCLSEPLSEVVYYHANRYHYAYSLPNVKRGTTGLSDSPRKHVEVEPVARNEDGSERCGEYEWNPVRKIEID